MTVITTVNSSKKDGLIDQGPGNNFRERYNPKYSFSNIRAENMKPKIESPDSFLKRIES